MLGECDELWQLSCTRFNEQWTNAAKISIPQDVKVDLMVNYIAGVVLEAYEKSQRCVTVCYQAELKLEACR
jgi:hypothetical protein